MNVYPGIFAGVGLIRLGVTGSGALSRWSQSIRDTEFLIEMRLRNYEQEQESEKNEMGKGRVYTEDVTGVEEAVGPAAD
jgi:E3 ubiquitin-protein ligase MARCH6